MYSCTRVCLCICVRGRVIVCARCKRDTTEILIKSGSTLNRLNICKGTDTIQTYPQVPHVASKTEQLSSGRLHSGKCSCHAKCKKSRRHSQCTRHHGGQERNKPPNVRFTMTTPIKLSNDKLCIHICHIHIIEHIYTYLHVCIVQHYKGSLFANCIGSVRVSDRA